MGTPHRGSRHADYAAVLSRIVQLMPGISSQTLLEELRPSALELSASRDRFCAYMRERKEGDNELGVSFFCETQETSVIGIVSNVFVINYDSVN